MGTIDSATVCRTFFETHPFDSIDTGIRAVQEAGANISRAEAASIRKDVRQRMAAIQIGGITVSSGEPANQIGSEKKSTKAEREAYLKEWADKHPLTTVVEAQQELKRHFGKGMGNAHVAEILKEIRDGYAAPPKGEPEPKPEPDEPKPATKPLQYRTSLEIFAHTLAQAGIRAIEILPDGSYRVEMPGSKTVQ